MAVEDDAVVVLGTEVAVEAKGVGVDIAEL